MASSLQTASYGPLMRSMAIFRAASVSPFFSSARAAVRRASPRSFGFGPSSAGLLPDRMTGSPSAGSRVRMIGAGPATAGFVASGVIIFGGLAASAWRAVSGTVGSGGRSASTFSGLTGDSGIGFITGAEPDRMVGIGVIGGASSSPPATFTSGLTSGFSSAFGLPPVRMIGTGVSPSALAALSAGSAFHPLRMTGPPATPSAALPRPAGLSVARSSTTTAASSPMPMASMWASSRWSRAAVWSLRSRHDRASSASMLIRRWAATLSRASSVSGVSSSRPKVAFRWAASVYFFRAST